MASDPKKKAKKRRTIAAGAAAALVLSATPFLAGWVGLGRISFAAGVAARAKAEVRLDKKPPVYVGTPVRYTVVVEARPPMRIDPPSWPKAGGDRGYELRLVRAEGHRRLLGGVRRRFQYELIFFQTGKVTVPGPSGVARDGTKKGLYLANPIQVTVQSLLPKDKAEFSPQDLRDVKPPLDLPFDWLGLAAFLLAAAVLAAAIWRAVRFLRRGREGRNGTPAAEIQPAEPAHQIAFVELEEIRTWPDDPARDAETFFIKLSDCIRRYLRNRFGLKAPELTTEELLPMAARDPRLPAEAGAALAGLASRWDLVKFAKELPPSEIMRAAWRQARDFVELTREDPAIGGDKPEDAGGEEAAS